MLNNENPNSGIMTNNDQQMIMPDTPNNAQTLAENVKSYRAMYPEVYFKLKPFITSTSDIIRSTNSMLPAQEELDTICDDILSDFCRMHPDMEEYMAGNQNNDPPEAVQTIVFGGRYRPGYGRPRRRGFGRDLIGGLLLAELLGGHRYPYAPYYPYYPYSPYY
ncbi:hypothetical protein IZU99_02930 [Oscillospiraceae bacterium CM]|nr:hypothetical protein IZU99_02930 [Oscillospiraceae bacterium CM]